jgi:hypothetical protein
MCEVGGGTAGLSGRGSEALKSIVDELGPRLNAYLRSIGPVVAARESRPP